MQRHLVVAMTLSLCCTIWSDTLLSHDNQGNHDTRVNQALRQLDRRLQTLENKMRREANSDRTNVQRFEQKLQNLENRIRALDKSLPKDSDNESDEEDKNRGQTDDTPLNQ